MALPSHLRSAIQSLSHGVGLKPVAAAQAGVSAHYRAGGATSGAVMSQDAVLAYAMARLPATYAAVARSLAELTNAFSDISISSVLDVGCGPGTAGFAALDAFAEAKTLRGIDHNRLFLDFASRLAAESGLSSRCDIGFAAGDLTQGIRAEPADLVICSYTLVELPEKAISPVISTLWSLAKSALVLVEPGSRAGFERLKRARQTLIAEGATVIAPCTHQHACPMPDNDWCHFSVRLPRSRQHRQIKGAAVPFEDEKLAYLVVARSGAPAFSGRIVAPVQRTKAGAQLAVCGSKILNSLMISSRDENFKAARKLEWGDGL